MLRLFSVTDNQKKCIENVIFSSETCLPAGRSKACSNSFTVPNIWAYNLALIFLSLID